jgi:putative two-component system response regulator
MRMAPLLIGAGALVLGALAAASLALRRELARNRFLVDEERALSEVLNARLLEEELSHDVTIAALASLAECHAGNTAGHLRRTQRYVQTLAEALSDHPAHRDELDPDSITMLSRATPLHDIGMAAVPEAILMKPGRLNEAESGVVRTHTELGAEALHAAEARLGSTRFLRIARDIVGSHHESWDGSGYPRGLAGSEIPLPGRLMAVADAYDALVSRARGHEEARATILQGRGTRFDPDVVDAFVSRERQFAEIGQEGGHGPEPALPARDLHDTTASREQTK